MSPTSPAYSICSIISFYQIITNWSNFCVEKSKSLWNKISESHQPKYHIKLRKIVSDAEEYLYESDPNFDFDNRNVKMAKNSKDGDKVKKYYQKVTMGRKKRTEPEFGETLDTPKREQFMNEVHKARQTHHASDDFEMKQREWDYRLSTVRKDKIAPGKMAPRAPYRLKEVCEQNNYNISIDDFDEEQSMIGCGTFGEVYVVRCKLNDYKYALKVLNKQKVKDYGVERHIMREKDILNMLNHPNVVRLEHYFHDSDNCYFLFELCEVGDLATFIQCNKRLSTRLTREFTMEMILGLEQLKELNVVHRDLKPQNILLDDTYHLKLTDFGAAKQINPEDVEAEIQLKSFDCDSDDSSIVSSSLGSDDDSSDEEEIAKAVCLARENTQIGSPLYISPEMLKYQIACFGSDLWALGCIIYECIVGHPPFTGKNKFEIEDKISDCDFSFPKGFNKNAKDLISRLLVADPSKRLGAGTEGSKNDMNALKSHPFFKGKSFKRCHKRVPALHTLKKYKKDSSRPEPVNTVDKKSDFPLDTIPSSEMQSPDSIRSLDFGTNKTQPDSNEIEIKVHDISTPNLAKEATNGKISC